MRQISCPLCQQEATRPVWEKVYGHLTVTTVLCSACGLVYHNPVVEDSDRVDLGLSHQELHTDASIRQRHLRRVAQRVARQTAFLEAVIRPGWRTLEIGCGLGLFSHWLSQQGCEAVGIEPDRQQAAYARKNYGLTIMQCRFEEAGLGQHFDFFASSHVIEHLPEPLEFLRRLRGLAAPGALLFLETPNILAPKVGPQRVFSLAHNFYFSPVTLRAALAKSGWQVVKSRIFYRDSFMVLARTARPQEPALSSQHAAEVFQAITRHRTDYYRHFLFVWRKIPLWRRGWMYRYQDFPVPAEPLSPSVSVE
ncbi:MAG: class I SAM-dependent methyltransferase [Desulfobacca sp.]|uniref:class I SAM-dependent methyltransferase n=1 Tax=Desulfobacca sp. TaxID=2067990 RepID=UPI00404B7881